MVHVPELDVQERHRQRHQHDAHRHQVQHGPAHHAGRHGVPQPALPARPEVGGDAQGVHARPEHAEHGGQHDQRGAHRDEHHGGGAEPDRAQEHLREQQQPQQRRGDGQPGVGHGAPGRGHGPHHGLLVRGPAGDLLPERLEHEQRVVDGQAEPEHGDDVQREDGHLGDGGEQPQQHQRAEDREQPHDQRQPGGHEAAEDDDEQHQQHGHGDGLGAGEVGGGLVVELAEEGD